MRFGMGFIAPFGRSRSRRYMFIGDVNMWRNFVIGRIARNARNDTTWMTQSQRCVLWSVCGDQFLTMLGERVADERPLLERGPGDERDARGLGEEPGERR